MDQIDNLVDINNNCHISPDDYDFLERKWRSVTVGNSINVFNFESSSNEYNTDKSAIPMKLKSIEASKTGVIYEAPSIPYCLVPTHFRSSQSLSVLVNDINLTLDNIAEVSYEFSEKCLEWQACYMRTPNSVKFQVNIYSNSKDEHIIEVNKLRGDCFQFKSVYSDIKSAIEIKESSNGSNRAHNDNIGPIPCPTYGILPSDIDIEMIIQPIKQMAEESVMESKLEASKIICRLTSHDGLQQQLADHGCVQILVDLFRNGNVCIKQNAICALANLSELPSCQSAIIDAGLITDLLDLAVDGPYHSAELGREGARILANISTRFSSKVVLSAGRSAVSSWVSKIDTLSDRRLKWHADRAKEKLVPEYLVMDA
jgi:hypothetical protein